MAYPSGTYINQIQDPAVRAELEQLYSLFQGYLSVQHKDNGSHGTITGDSLNLIANTTTGATGDVIADGNGTFDGNVTADADGKACILGIQTNGTLSYVNDGAVSVTSGSSRKWALVATTQGGSIHTLKFFDVTGVGSLPYFKLITGTYYFTPGSSGCRLGDGLSTERWSGVDTQELNNTGANIFSGIKSPAQITADQNNYNPTGLSTGSLLRLDLDAARSITGIAAQSNGFRLTLSNISGFALTLVHNSASSTAANRILCPGGVNYTVSSAGGVRLYYDTVSAFWRFEDN